MIESIKELNFPYYATLDSATVTMNDMGEKTISTQVKISGDVVPDFSYDWEIEFKGEKYIQPLRKPQGVKDNSSARSKIDLVFHHWAIYQLKNNYFVELASTEAGIAFADKYVVPLRINLGEFVTALNNVLAYYYPDRSIYAELNPSWSYAMERVDVELDYTYLWDIVQKIHELFSVRWVIEKDNDGNYAIRVGYPAGELDHIFEYGFESGLLKIERQVQDSNIRNKIYGRGGSQNLPYLYFKDFEKYPQGEAGDNQGMTPDPDAIPELRNIHFSELRNSNFRNYIQGWKTNPNRILIGDDRLEVYDVERGQEDWAYEKGATDLRFDPVDYVKDDESIEEYGILPGKAENVEDAFPSLQGMKIEINGIETRADEIVAVQEVVTDKSDDQAVTDNSFAESNVEARSESKHKANIVLDRVWEQNVVVKSVEFTIPEGARVTDISIPQISNFYIYVHEEILDYYIAKRWEKYPYSSGDEEFPEIISYKIIDIYNKKEVPLAGVVQGRYRIDFSIKFPKADFPKGTISTANSKTIKRVDLLDAVRYITISVNISYKDVAGELILNANISKSAKIPANGTTKVSLIGDEFSVSGNGATMIDAPIWVDPEETTIYTQKTIKVLNKATNESVNIANIPQGDYVLIVDVELINTSASQKTVTVKLLPTYLIPSTNLEQWQPTFDVWIKNIFNTKKTDYLSEQAYTQAVWDPLYTGDEMMLTFSSGNLSGHSDWEFRVLKGGIAYDNSKVIIDSAGNEIRSEWRLTLIKSDAELETIKKYIPYKDFNAKAGDFFYFTGILLPHQYTLSAEKLVTTTLEDTLVQVKDIKPQWVISLDKVRAHRDDANKLVDQLTPGMVVTLKDKRFTANVGERQILQSITYTWQEGLLLPNIDVVLSDKIVTSLSTVAMLQSQVESLSKQVGGISNIEQIVRKVGDLLYLRKDGIKDESYSPTKFADTVSSDNFRPGSIGGSGWGMYKDANNRSVIEVDKLFVRNEMNVNSLIVNQIAALGGTKILSAADMTVSAVDTIELDDGQVGIKCFFETKGASKSNLFAVDDIAYSNIFDSDNMEMKYYKRRVIGIGEDYIILSTTDVDGNSSPQEGDVIVQYGNFTDTARQSFIIIEPLNGGKIEIYSGVNSFNLTDKNIVGMGVDPETNEAFLYGYGDMYFGDREGRLSFMRYSRRDGELRVKANVTIEEGSIMTSRLDVGEADSDNIEAFFNGGDFAKDTSEDGHGKLILAGGIPEGTTELESRAKLAKTRIYEDGHIATNDIAATGGEFQNIIVKGSSRSPFESSVSYMSQTSDNYYNLGDSTQFAQLTDDISQSGRRMTFIGSFGIMCFNTEKTTYGYIYDRGKSYYKEYLYIGNKFDSANPWEFESVTLVAVPTSSTKVAWVVESRKPYGESHNSNVNVYGMFGGLRPQTRVVNSDTTLTDYDHTIIVEAGCTITLPKTPQIGQRYEFYKVYNGSLYINPNGQNVYATGSYGGGNGTTPSTATIGTGFKKAAYIYTGSHWFRTVEDYN